MAVNNTLDSSRLLQRVDILRVVVEEFVAVFKHLDELVGKRGGEVGGENFFCQIEKRCRIVVEIVNVKHQLRIVKVGIFFSNDGVETAFGSEIGNAAGDGNLKSSVGREIIRQLQ